MSQLFPDLPYEIRTARLGMCYDPVRRQLVRKAAQAPKIAISYERLHPDVIHKTDGIGTLRLKADASTAENAQKTFFSLDSKLKIGSWFSLGFSTEQSRSSVNTNSALNCYCSYVYGGQFLELVDVGPEALFNCMTDAFQSALTDLLNAPTANKLINFYREYGYGCVTQLRLTSGSAFTMQASFHSAAAANTAKYAGSVGIGTPWGGGSVASGFAKEILNSDSAASLTMLAEQLPQDTPTMGWCNATMSAVMNLGLAKLAQSPAAVQPYTGAPPTAPEIPQGKPSAKKLPDKEFPPLDKALKDDIMKQDGFRGTWEQYLEAQRREYEKLKPDQVVRETLEHMDELLSKDLDPLPEPVCEPPEEDTKDLGGYIPYDYGVTAWSDLFPQLKTLKLPATFSSIYLAKAYVYYLTRQQFAGYINFLADVGPLMCENPNIVSDAAQYSELCSRILVNISNVMNANGKFTAQDYEAVVARFEQDLKQLSRFYSQNTYWYFFNHYRFFIDNAYGFIAVNAQKNGRPTSYWAFGPNNRVGTRRVPQPFSVTAMMSDNVHVYQVLTNRCHLKSVCYYISGWWEFHNIIGGISAKPRKDSDGYTYYLADNKQSEIPDESPAANDLEYRLYGAGFAELRALKNMSVYGRPMISDFDFDNILNFANPDRPLGVSLKRREDK